MQSFLRALLLSVPLLLAPLATAELGTHEYSTGPYTDDARVWRDASELDSYDDFDIDTIRIQEPDPDVLRVELVLADPADAEADRPPMERVYEIGFTALEAPYRLWLGDDVNSFDSIPPDLSTVPFVARLFLELPGEDQQLAELQPQATESGWTVDIPRDQVQGANLEPLLAGTVLEDIHATAYGEARDSTGCSSFGDAGACTLAIRDREPVEGSLAGVTLERNPRHEGSLGAYSPLPMRASNGEATTYLYEVLLTNYADQPTNVQTNIQDVPGSWFVDAPSSLTLEPRSTTTLPLAVQVPFQHEHGKSATFNASFTSSIDDTTTNVQLGVHWLEIAQPSGHHPSAYLHASGNDEWVNTQPSTSEIVPLFASACLVCGEDSLSVNFSVAAPLSPALRLGLDALLNEEGVFQGVLGSTVTMDVIGRVHVVHVPDAGEEVVLFRGESNPIPMAAGDAVPFEVPLQATSDADYYPVDGPTQLSFRFWFQGLATPDAYAQSMAGQFSGDTVAWIDGSQSRMDLPLQEFHDPLSGNALLAASLQPKIQDGLERRIPPGGTAEWTIRLDSDGSIPRVLVTLHGESASSARSTATALNLPSDAGFDVSLTVPRSAQADDVHEVVVRLTDADQHNRQVALVLRAIVDPSRGPAAEDNQATPASGGIALAMALIGLAVAARNARD